MIITLKGASFKSIADGGKGNIGTLTTWNIWWDGDGISSTSGLPTSIDRGTALTVTIPLSSSYTAADVPVTINMGASGDVTSSCTIDRSTSGKLTITIPSVTGNVNILVGTSNSSSGEDSGDSGDSGNTDTSAVFDYDFTTNTIDDYALEGVFTVPDGSTTSDIEYDSTYGMSLNSNLPNGLNLVNPLDASKAWELEFTALFVTPTVLAGNRRAFLAGADLYPFVFINGSAYDSMGFQISNGTHATLYGILTYDKEATYKVSYDGAGKVYVTIDGVDKGNVSVDFTGKQFTVILGNVVGKSTAYVWQNVETNKSYLKKLKFKYV